MMWESAATFSFSIASYVVVFVMVLMAVNAVVASLKGHGNVLIVIFALLFFSYRLICPCRAALDPLGRISKHRLSASRGNNLAF